MSRQSTGPTAPELDQISTSAGSDGMSLFECAGIMLANLRQIVLASLVTAGVVVAVTILRGTDFTAQSSFSPQSSGSSLSRVAGIASQFGFQIPSAGEDQSVHFYRSLILSREILQQIALSKYHFEREPASGDSLGGDIISLYEIDKADLEQNLLAAVELLKGKITVRVDMDANLVSIETASKWPDHAEQVNRRILDLVNDFNVKRRRSMAAAEREFIEGRVKAAQHELESAETALERFLEQNRSYEGSPQLRFEAARLQRRVDLRQQVYTSLAQAYEEARIEEVRNTPLITIVDAPEGSASRRRGLLLRAVLGLVIGGVVGLAYALSRHLVARERARREEEFIELTRLRRRAIRSLVPWGKRQ